MIDLVCWDFGDTLVDEMFMRLAPEGVPDWPAAYEQAIGEDPTFVDRLDCGDAALVDLVPTLGELLPMAPAAIARHLRAVFHRIEWLPGMRELVGQLDGRVLQAVVTVNPHEFGAMAVACGLEPLVDVIVTSADVASPSKVVMAHRARALLDRSSELDTTILIDNKAANIEEFVGAGGRGLLFERERFHEAWADIEPLLPRRPT